VVVLDPAVADESPATGITGVEEEDDGALGLLDDAYEDVLEDAVEVDPTTAVGG